MDIISLAKVIILGIVEGITEFIPVSSTGHLILTGNLLHLDTPEGTFEIALQLGAILAVVALYRDFFRQQLQPAAIFGKANQKIMVGILPFLCIGFFFYSSIKALFSEQVVLTALIVGGVVMCIVDGVFYYRASKAPAGDLKSEEAASAVTDHHLDPHLNHISFKQAFIVGIFQCFAFIPGMSRSGSTIVGGVVSGLSYASATRFSFLLSVPVMICAVGYELLKSFRLLSVSDLGLLGIGIAVSFVSGYLSMVFLLRMINRWKLIPFGLYRIVLGSVGLFFLIYLKNRESFMKKLVVICIGLMIGCASFLWASDVGFNLSADDVSTPIDAAFVGAMKDPEPSPSFLTDIAIKYAEHGDFSRAKAALDVIESYQKPNAHITGVIKVAKAMVSINRFDDALSLAKTVKETKRDMVLEAIAMESLQVNNLSQALKASADIGSVFIYSRIVHQIAETYANQQNFDSAISLAKKITYPDQRDQTNFAVGKALVTHGKLSTALDISSNISRDELRYELINSIVEAYVEQGSIDEAVLISYTISSESDRAHALKHIIRYYSIQKNYLLAYEYLEMMSGNLDQQEGIGEVVYGLIYNFEFEEAGNLMEEIIDADIKNNVYQRSAIYLANKGKLEKATEYADKIMDRHILSDTYYSLGLVFGKERQYHFPLLLLRQISSAHSRDKALEAFVMSFREEASSEKVVSVADQIADPIIRFDTLKALHRYYIKHELPADAAIVIEKAKSTTEEMMLVFNQVAYEVSIDHLESSENNLQRLEKLVLKLPNAQKLDTYLKLADLYLMLGKKEAGVESLKNASRLVSRLNLSKDTAYSSIAIKYSMLNLPTDALVYVKKISKKNLQLKCLLDFDKRSYPDKQSSTFVANRVTSLYSNFAGNY